VVFRSLRYNAARVSLTAPRFFMPISYVALELPSWRRDISA